MFAERNITTERRRSTRSSVQIDAVLHAAQSSQTVTITNLAPEGVGLHVAVGLMPGDVVEIELKNGRMLPGEVVWRLMGSCGIHFSEPLSEDDPLLQI